MQAKVLQTRCVSWAQTWLPVWQERREQAAGASSMFGARSMFNVQRPMK
jgi:hypothetical protein